MNTYQSDSTAAIQLSAEERKAAEQLKAVRPAVVQGTRAIINRADAEDWFKKVTQKMRDLGFKDQIKVNAFCDLAGVPD